MTVAVTTRTQIPAEVTDFYDRVLLTRVVAKFVHTRWAQVRDLPRKVGTKVINFRRYGNLSAATTPLTEGTTPTGSQLSVTKVTATVAQYGDYVTVTDVLDYESQDPVLMEAAEVLGDQAGDTLDQLTRDIIVAGTVVRRVNGRTLRTDIISTDIVTADDVKKTVRTLKNANAMKVTSMVAASPGQETTPLNACFIGLVHPNTTYTLKKITGFIPVEKYGSQAGVMDGEVGALDEVRFVETTNAKVFTAGGAGGIDVYGTLILGANAYGTTRVAGEAMKNIVKPLGSGEDPLDQRATSGWKGTFVAKILNDAFMGRIEHAIES